VYQRREWIIIDRSGGYVSRVDRVGKGGWGGDTVEDIIDLWPGAFLGVGGHWFRGAAIAFPRHVELR